MKKILLLCFCFSFSVFTFAQNLATSTSASFDIRKKIEPPLLEFIEAPSFVDADGNKAINANEASKIVFKLKNNGKGDGLNLRFLLSATGNTSGISFLKVKPLANVSKLGGTQAYELEINSDINTEDGIVNFTLEVDEPNGFGTEKVNIEVNTRKFLAPNIEVVDYVLYSGTSGSTNLELKKPFSLQVLIQNIGQGVAKNVQLNMKLPENVYITNGEATNKVIQLLPGEKKSFDFEMILNNKYLLSTLTIDIELLESLKKFAKNWTQTFKLNQALSQNKIVVQASKEVFTTIETASLRSDVDKDIPSGLPTNSTKYALIIGCEDYAKFQTNLDNEVNVDFAANDANIFSEYAQITLGFPKEQIYTLINPTSSQIKQYIDRLQKAIEIEKGNAEIIFYYSGHGLPEPNTNEPFLIPVDVNGNNPQDGVSLIDLYAKLSKFPSAKTTVILDACFSGGARNKELVALKGIKVKPKMDAVPSNILVLASCKGTESSAVYKEKQHGYFTYFLLKNLKEKPIDQSFNDLFMDINYQVSKEVLKIGKTQTPDFIPGVDLGDNWRKNTW